MENREQTSLAPARALDDETSGVHLALWRAHAVAPLPEGWGAWGEELARRLVAELGARVLRRFPRLSRADGAAVLDAAATRLVRSGPPSVGPIAEHVRRTVFCEAIPLDRARFVEEVGASPEEVKQRLELARRRLAMLTGRERSVLSAVFTLDSVAEEDEVGKVVLHAAVAYQMRWNTAHQNVSRAWRKICDGGLAEWGTEWRAAHRFVCGPPSFELWSAARDYLDACSGRGNHGGPAFEAWTRAHEDHNAWFNEWKKQSNAATQRWRAFVQRLDRGGPRPGDLVSQLVASCGELGIDRWVVPAKVPHQTWRELLGGVPRPGPEARGAWWAFFRAHTCTSSGPSRPALFGADVEAAFRELEREAALAEVASSKLEGAYHRLLEAAERRSAEGVRAKDELRCLLEAARWT